MKNNFKKLTILSIVTFSLLAFRQVFAMREDKPQLHQNYKSGSFNVQTITDVMNSGRNRRTIKKENLENKSSNVDFNIICEFANGETIEFEARFGEIEEFNCPDCVTSIGDNAFDSCRNLTSINIPEGVTEIGYAAFLGCRNLKTINIPNSVMRIDRKAFKTCKNLTTIIYNKTEYHNGVEFLDAFESKGGRLIGCVFKNCNL